MNDADLISRLKKKIREHMNDTADHMSADGCRTIEEYKKCCGIVEGLALAERELLDLNKQIERD